MNRMKLTLDFLFSNFINYDFIIFIFGGVNFIIFLILFVSIFTMKVKISDNTKILKFIYILYQNITSAFTLLGVLGTVISLMSAISDENTEIEMIAFAPALTSTFWGLIFAICYKVIESVIDAAIDDGEKQ